MATQSQVERAPRRVETPRSRPRPARRDYEVSLESLSQWQLAWRKFKKHRLALIGLGILLVLFVVAIVGPFLHAVRLRRRSRSPDADRLRRAGRRRSSTPSARPAASSATSSCSSSTAPGRRS